jgi:hypothetical protein
LCACARAPDGLVVRGAGVSASTLQVRSDWHPHAQILDALDHGIALSFAIRLRAQAPSRFGWQHTVAQRVRRVQLRYYPLVRAYQLHDLDEGSVRNYAARAQALAALGDLRLPLHDWDAHGATQLDVRIALERDDLPGALRLPALFDRAWRVDSGDFAWRTPG